MKALIKYKNGISRMITCYEILINEPIKEFNFMVNGGYMSCVSPDIEELKEVWVDDERIYSETDGLLL